MHEMERVVAVVSLHVWAACNCCSQAQIQVKKETTKHGAHGLPDPHCILRRSWVAIQDYFRDL